MKTEADHYGEIARQHREAAKKPVSQEINSIASENYSES
jgi:hypothetical protein